jgi:hypothetical protein
MTFHVALDTKKVVKNYGEYFSSNAAEGDPAMIAVIVFSPFLKTGRMIVSPILWNHFFFPYTTSLFMTSELTSAVPTYLFSRDRIETRGFITFQAIDRLSDLI